MIEFIDLYITGYNISQITIFDWTLSTSDHTTLIHSSLSLPRLNYLTTLRLSRLNFWSQSHSMLARIQQKTLPLIINGRLLLFRIVVRITQQRDLPPREGVYRAVAQQWAYASQYFYLDSRKDVFFSGWCVILRIKGLLD
jgi:hypothetical protein